MHLLSTQTVPHFSKTDALYALSCLFRRSKPDVSALFNNTPIRVYSSARTGLRELLIHLKIPKNKKVAIPAFTCAVLALPAIYFGYEIEWIDTDELGVLNPADLQKKIENVGVIIAPHIYGNAAPLAAIAQIAKARNVPLIADGAHRIALSDLQYADYLLLSFGREKVISCVSGGAVLALSEEKLPAEITKKPSFLWITQHLLQPLLLSFSVDFWSFGGKYIAGALSKLKVLPRAVSSAEKKGKWDAPVTTMPNAMRHLLVHMAQQKNRRIDGEKKNAIAWGRALAAALPGGQISIPKSGFRTVLRHKKAAEIVRRLKLHGFQVGDWTGIPLSPRGVDLSAFGYRQSQCPMAEAFAQSHVTFPTHFRVRESDIRRCIDILKT